MRMSMVGVGLVILLGVGLLVGTAQSEDEAGNPAAQMAKLMELTQPGARHAAMEYFLGTWDVAFSMKMPGMPETPPTKGEATFEWAIQGRWMMERLKGTLMGRAYESVGLHGFDNYAKNYVSASVSSMDTALNVLRGIVSDPRDETIVQYGTLDEYMLGDQNHPLKTVTRRTGDDAFTVEVWDLGMGPSGAVVVEMKYTRRK